MDGSVISKQVPDYVRLSLKCAYDGQIYNAEETYELLKHCNLI